MPYLRKLPSGKWQAQVKRHGRAWTATRATKAAARVWALELEDRLDRGITDDPHAGRATVGEWATRWWDARVAEPTTMSANESRLRVHVLPEWGDKRLEAVTALDVQGWVRRLEKDSVYNARESYALLRSILAAAVRDRLIPVNPCDHVRLPPLPQGREVYLTREQVDTITGHCTPRDGLIVLTLAYSGLRWSELAGLRLRRLDVMRRRIQVVEVVTALGAREYGKSRSSFRDVPIPQHLADQLAAYLRDNPAGWDDYVFRNKLGGPMMNTTFRRLAWAPAVRAAGLDHLGVRIHDLRHTAASWLVQAGVPLYDVSKFLGHSSINITARYAHLAPDSHDRVSAALEREGLIHTPFNRPARR